MTTMRATLFASFCLIMLLPAHAGTVASPVVAVTIKPLHSLVAGVMKGVGQPLLVMRSNASPHHYSLKPSERRALADAELVFWIGAELEAFMPRVIDSLDHAKDIPLIESPGLLQLPARSVHEHGEAHAHIDPHVWLSPQNAHVMVDAIADALGKLDPAHAQTYQANRERLHQRISAGDSLARDRLAGKTSGFLSYHDAYQYFEHAYGLKHAGFLSSGEEINPGAKYVHELRNKIREQQLHCLFYEAPARPALVDTLTQGLGIDAIEIDAMGMRLEAGEDAWFDIINGLTEAFESCL